MATVILAERFNTLRTRVNRVLGRTTNSDPTFGYGQAVTDSILFGSRSGIIDADKITAQDYIDLYIDLVKVRAHQIGIENINVFPFVTGNYEENQESTDKVEENFIINLENIASTIEQDRLLIDTTTQADVNGLTNSTGVSTASTRFFSQRGSWNNTIEHIIDVEFLDSASRRHFFNSGGEFRVSFSIAYSGSQLKTVEWKNAGADIGTVRLRANSTVSSALIGRPSSIGNYQLTSTYQLCYRYNIGGNYSNNFYEVYAMQLDSSTIRVKMSFVDGRPNDSRYGIDENVLGDITSEQQLLTPNGSAVINDIAVDTVVFTDTIIGSTVSQL